MTDQNNTYTVIFDESNRYYSQNPVANTHQLVTKQAFANEKLSVRGHLFLNEVYDMLGFNRTRDGQLVGWIYKGPQSYISFGLEELIERDHIGPITLTIKTEGEILDILMSENAARP
jgi:hypothetical protein